MSKCHYEICIFLTWVWPPPPFWKMFKKLQIWRKVHPLSRFKIAAIFLKGALIGHKWLSKKWKSINKSTINPSKYVKYISVCKTFKLVNLITVLPAGATPCGKCQNRCEGHRSVPRNVQLSAPPPKAASGSGHQKSESYKTQFESQS